MDWKILVVVVAGLIIFFAVQRCTEDDKPNYDRIQAEERARRQREFAEKQDQSKKKKETEAREAAEEQRADRPAPSTASLENEQFVARFTTRGGALQSLVLKDQQYLESPRNPATGMREEEAEEVPIDLVSTNPAIFEKNAPLRFEIYENEGLEGLLEETDFTLVEQTDQIVRLRYTQAGIPATIHTKYELASPAELFQFWMTVRVENTGSEKFSFRAAIAQRGYQHESEGGGSIFSKQPNLLKGICRFSEETNAFAWNEDDLETPFIGIGNVGFVGVETNYFLTAMVPEPGTPASCQLSRTVYRTRDHGDGWLMKGELRFAEVILEPGQSKTFKLKNYLGPKRFQVLRTVGSGLETSVDLGLLEPICRLLLALLFAFQSVVVNWGVAIILLTVVVKVALMPLTHRSFKSTDKMKSLKPEVDKINEKHKDDPQAKQQATMALYKQHGVNPLGGCLPTLLQMPIWFALFSTLRTSPELYRAPFFGWITDLSSPDPFFVTPVVMGAMMFLQQRFTPMTGDSAQAKMMMYFMPVMFTAMMLFLPSGLTLYILVNTVLSIGHQVIIHRQSSKKAAPVKGRK